MENKIAASPAEQVGTPKQTGVKDQKFQARKPRPVSKKPESTEIVDIEGQQEPTEFKERGKSKSRSTRGGGRENATQRDNNGEAEEKRSARQRTRDFKNVFSSAIIEPEQIRETCIEHAQSTFMETQVLLDKLRGKGNFAKVTRQHERVCEIDPKFGILDFSLKANSRKSKDVDNSYFLARNNLEIWTNVKEGNTLLLEYNPDEDNRLKTVSFLRQGLPKFFTLTADAVSAAKRSVLPRDSELAYYQYDTLAQVKKALMEGSKIEVLRSLKTNGDSAYITWSQLLEAWVITSQNVSLLARNEQDVKTHYPEQSRYYLSRKIALCWLRKVKYIEKMGKGKIETLKQDLADKVFIGDFLGNSELINLIKYPRETICFHSVVQKYRTNETAKDTAYCLPNSTSILKRHSLDVVPTRVCGIFENYDALCDNLSEVHKQVSNSSLSASEEGAVLTFIRHSSTGPDTVISMCKIKSVEYQTLRLMVDLLQNSVESGNLERLQDTVFTRFVKEFKAFSKNISAEMESHPEIFYTDLFSTAYTMLAKKSTKDKEMYRDMLFSDTVKFLVLVLKTNEEKNTGKRYIGQIDLESQLFHDQTPGADETFQRANDSAQAHTPSENMLDEFKTETPYPKQRNEEVQAKAKNEKRPKNIGAKVTIVTPVEVVAAPAKAKQEETPQTSGPLLDITSLVVPPYALSKTLMERIKENYEVIEASALKVDELESIFSKKRSSQPVLVVLSSLDDITEQSRLCNLKLFAFKCSDAYKGEPANNFYLDAENYYAHQSFQSISTAAIVRKEVEKMIKVANSPKMIKLLNPARMHLNTEEELMVVLQLQEPPSMDDTQDFIEEHKQEVHTILVERPTPTPTPSITEKVFAKKTKENKKSKLVVAQAPISTPLPAHQVSSKQSQIMVVFPIGIPGMGKTHFAKNTLNAAFKQMGLDEGRNLSIIQNDLVRKICLENWLQDNPKMSISEGVKATAQKSINMFKDQLNEALTKMSKNKTQDLQMIYLDKNYPPAEIKITLQAINDHPANASAIIRKVALVPYMAENSSQDFPFSINFLLQCYIRCLERQGHLTMSNDDPERLAKILVLFFQQFKGTQFSENFAKEFGFDNLLKVRFTLEHEDLQLPPKLEKCLRQAINQSDLTQLDAQVREIVHLIDLYRSLFSGSCHTSQKVENTDLITKSLIAFTNEFKEQVNSQQATPSQKNQSSFQVDDTIEESDHEESDYNEAISAEVSKKLEIVEDQLKHKPVPVVKRAEPIKTQAAGIVVQRPSNDFKTKPRKIFDDELDFEEEKGRNQKKKDPKPEVKPEPEPAPTQTKKSSYTPRRQTKNDAGASEGFETIQNKKQRASNDSK